MSYDCFFGSMLNEKPADAKRSLIKFADKERSDWAFLNFPNSVRWNYKAVSFKVADSPSFMGMELWLHFDDDNEALMFKLRHDVPESEMRKSEP